MNAPNPQPALELDAAAINDFRDEFDLAYETITQTLCDLEKDPANDALLHALFRSVHSIKGNFRMIGLNWLSDYIHSMENLMDQLRAHTLQFDARMSDILLLGIDRARSAFEQCAAGNVGDASLLLSIGAAIDKIKGENSDNAGAMNDVMRLLDPTFEAHDVNNPQLDSDLKFFASFARFLEHRALVPTGRTDRVLALALDLNTAAGNPVNPQQLTAAVYLHDVGMAFLPREVLTKKGDLTVTELAVIQSHVDLGADLLDQLGNWDMARQIVRQHHEHVNGEGYPSKLPGDLISDGAKILAIADTFEAMSHERADGRNKRPLLRVVTEINGGAGSQFDRKWVEVFIQVIRQRHVKHPTSGDGS